MFGPASRSPILVTSVLLGLGCGAGQNPAQGGALQATPAPRQVAVATESTAATDAALEVLEQGGNAVDAAIAAALVAGVVQPVSSGIGGGGFALVWVPGADAAKVYDFRETAPAALVAADYAAPIRKEKPGVAVGVPGELAGLTRLHQTHGSAGFPSLMGRAVHLAKNGFEVTPHMARVVAAMEDWVRPNLPMFVDATGLRPAGSMITRPELGQALETVAREGIQALYGGQLGVEYVEAARSAGSTMTLEDLTRYEVVERSAVRFEWKGMDVWTMPPPSAGGILLGQTLLTPPAPEQSGSGLDTALGIRRLADGFRSSLADRFRLVGDPAYVTVDTAALLNPTMLLERARRFEAAKPRSIRAELEEHGTTHLCVADATGMVVALTTTVNGPFGAQIATRSGILLNNELDDFLMPETLAAMGMKESPNTPRAGARPVSSMSPTLVVKGGVVMAAAGGSGGMRIPTNVVQVLLRHFVDGMPPEQAVAAPRFFPVTSGGLWLDEGMDSLAPALDALNDPVKPSPKHPTAVQLIARGADGAWLAGADPRKSGKGATQSLPR